MELNIVASYGLRGASPVVSRKESNAEVTGDVGSISGSGRSPGGGYSKPLQYSCLENPMDKEPGGLQSIDGKQRDTTEAS